MSTASSILTDIHGRLDGVRNRRHRVQLQSGTLVFATTFVLLAVIAALFELLLSLDTAGRTILFFALAALSLVLFGWHILQPVLRSLGVLRSIDNLALAAQIGNFFPQIHDRLLNLLQLDTEINSGKSLYSPELVDASFTDLAENIRGLDFTSAVDHGPVKRARNFFLLSTIGAILVIVASPTRFYNSVFRLLHFNTEFVSPPEFLFEISPGNKEITKGQAVEITVTVHPTSPEAPPPNEGTLALLSRQEGQTAYERTDLHSDSAGMYSAVLQSVRSSTEYFAQLSGVTSEHYLLTVIDRPIIRSFHVRLNFPPYSKLPPRVQDEFAGEVSGLPGTRVSLTGSASKDLDRGRIVFGNGKSLPLAISDQKFSTSFALEVETNYHLEITDRDSLSNADPVDYQIKLVPDEPPSVTIEQPGRNIDLAGDQFLPLLVQAKDDFGISTIRLGYRLIHSRYEKPWKDYRFITLPLPAAPTAQLEVPHTWDLSPMRLAPEDVVEYFAEAFDNDAVRGPKSARSKMFLIRLPSLEEVFTEIDKGHETSIEDLKQTLEEAKQLKEKIESINQDMKQNKEMDWHQQKKLEEMAKEYQELQKKLNEVQNRLNEMVQKMDQQNVLSPETLQKYLELQQLFDQLNSTELQQALKRMQMAMQNVSKEQLQQAMQKLTFSEEQFRQSIERTIDLLKRIQIEQKLDEARKRAEELQKTQQELSDQTSKSGDDQQKLSDVAKKQRDLAESQKQLEQEAADVGKRMEEFFTEMPVDKMQQLNAEMQQQQVGEMMKHAADQLKQGQGQQAQGTQGQVQQQLKSFASQLQSIQKDLLQRQTQHVLNELRRSINNLLELSKQQEGLKDQSQNAPPNSPQLRENAEGQMQVIRDMGNVVNGLVELSKRSFAVTPEMGRSIGEAMTHMRTAMSALEARNGYGASREQGLAMGSLNKAAMQVQNAMESMMQGGGSGMGGLLQQLQALAGKQESINMQTLEMRAAAEAARLAVGQEAVRKSMEQLAKEAEASGEQKKILGDLDKIAQDMKEVVRNLEQNDVNPETIHKQERILSRLLDASKSMRERDYEKRRKSETGKEIARRSPSELDASTLEGQNRILDDLLKALQEGYSKDYQELIRKYFDALQNSQLQGK